MSFEINYLVSDVEEYNQLKKDISNLLENYSFVTDSHTKILVVNSRQIDDERTVHIFPQRGEIEKIGLVGGLETKARVCDINNKKASIKIGNVTYQVWYSHKESNQ